MPLTTSVSITRSLRSLLNSLFCTQWMLLASIFIGLVGSDPGYAAQIDAEATVYRDDYGVPHIYADVEEHGFYGLGYAEAEDQLELILHRHLKARGEAASVLGSDFIESDFQSRLWMRTEEAHAGFKRLSSQLQRNYTYYVAGVNRYMREHPEEIPAGVRALEPIDPVVHSNTFLWGNYNVGPGYSDCRSGGVELSARTKEELDRSKSNASNEWLLAPWRTADNAAIFLTDPHGGIDGGAFVYEARLHAGSIHSAGYNVGPMLLLNHTRHIAWGLTTGAPDVADCFEVEVDSNNPRRYRFDGEWKEMITREVTVDVAGAESVTRTFEYTRHNNVLSPVVARMGNKAYVVSTSYMGQAGVVDEEIYRLNLAKNIEQAREALRSMGFFPQNLMIADKEGQSYYVRIGRTPRRPGGYDWTRPVPGNTSTTAWQGIHPIEDLVQIETPKQGYMQNSNILPDIMVVDSPLTEDRYPDYIYNKTLVLNGRGFRALDVLSRATHFTLEEAIELSLDEKWAGSELWQATLKRAVDDHPQVVARKSIEFRRVLHGLLNFDGFSRAESVAALHYIQWRKSLFSLLTPKELGIVLNSTEHDEEVDDQLQIGVLEGVERVTEALLEVHGTTEVRLGDVYRIGRRDGPSFPLGGITIMPENYREMCGAHDLLCVMTLRAFGEELFDGKEIPKPDKQGHRLVRMGSRMLLLSVFTDPIQSFSLLNFGQSQKPDSQHYTDQARLSSERRLKPVYFDKADLMRHVVSTTTLHVQASN